LRAADLTPDHLPRIITDFCGERAATNRSPLPSTRFSLKEKHFMNSSRLTIVTGLLLTSFVSASAQPTQSTPLIRSDAGAPGVFGQTASDGAAAQQGRAELQRRIEQLRLLSSQATDLARESDQNAANEDRLAQTGPSWARLVHQLAAVKFRSLATQNRETSRQRLTEAQDLERQLEGQRSRVVAAEARVPAAVTLAAVTSAPSHEDYLVVTDDAPAVERAIESYLTRTGIKASSVAGNNGAVHFVMVGFSGANGIPNLQYRISVLAPTSNGNEPKSQLIGITLDTNVRASSLNEPLYVALAEANKIGNCAWFVDSDQIRCRSWIDIPGPAYPVPAELVRDKIRMINGEWMRFSTQIMNAAK
jgi:hypothetical protein